MPAFNLKAFIIVVIPGSLGFLLLFLLSRLPYIGLIFYVQMGLALAGAGMSYANLVHQYGTKPDMFSAGVYGGMCALLISVMPAVLALNAGSAMLTTSALLILAFILGVIGGALYPAVMIDK